MRSCWIAKALALLAIISVTTSAKAADDRVTMFGYFRVLEGATVSPSKGSISFYGLPGTNKFRLGNEGDWAEWGWNLLAYKGEDGTVGHAVIMMGGIFSNNTQGGSNSIGPVLQQLFVDLQKIPGLDATLWIGQKFYKREYVNLIDTFYWSNQGFGAGIEDINLGAMKLSYGIFALNKDGGTNPPLSGAKDNGFFHDVRLTGIQIMEGGRLALGGGVAHAVSDTKDLKPGYYGTVQYVQDMLGGNNQLAVQFEGGSMGDAGGFGVHGNGITLQSSTDPKKFRVLDDLSINPTKELNLQILAIYQRDMKNGTSGAGLNQDWFGAGTRLTYALGAHFSGIVEAGFDLTKSSASGAKTLMLWKVTPALEVNTTQGNVPRIRLFVNYTGWNKDAQGKTQAGGGPTIGAKKSSAFTAGLQGETWF
jgi:maltoporin